MNIDKNPYSGLVVSGTHTSVGKSSLSLGLMRLLKRKGRQVYPFKAGPDYIDPGHHKLAAGRPSYNLDSWMCSTKYIQTLFSDVMDPKGVAVVEGVMGLFDGAYPKRDRGTTAEIAKLLNLPVLLVVDASTSARSIAALVKGFIEFDPDLKFLGVIVNRVNHIKHAKLLKEAIEYYTPARYLGHLPYQPDLEIPSRHLGLYQGLEQNDDLYDRWADHIEQHINMKLILSSIETTQKQSTQKPVPSTHRWPRVSQTEPFTVGVAKDEAFQFIYQDTLDLFRHFGGKIKFFSPLHDSQLPKKIDWIYFPGGYPELNLKQLSNNHRMRSEILKFGKSGKVIVAECGGLMYLGKSITDETGQAYPMTGLFKFSSSVKDKQLTMGYRRLAYEPSNRLDKKIILKGHEFHFSKLVDSRETPQMIQAAHGKNTEIQDGFKYKNCLATYSHIYWPTSRDWLKYVLYSMKTASERKPSI